MRRLFAVLVTLFLAITPAVAQARRGNPAQGRGGVMTGPKRPDQPGGAAQQRIRASAQQRDQYNKCVQLAERVRNRVREMTRAAKKHALTAELAAQWHEQLQNEIQQMQEEHERLLAGLTEEQKTAAEKPVKKAEQAKAELESFSDALAFELDAAELDQEKIEDQGKKIEAAVQRLRAQYRTIGDYLQMQASPGE